MLSLEQSALEVYRQIWLLRKPMEHSMRFPLTKLLNGSTNYVSCPAALLVSPKQTLHEIVSASQGERGLLFLKQHSICSASAQYLLGIRDDDQSLTTRKHNSYPPPDKVGAGGIGVASDVPPSVCPAVRLDVAFRFRSRTL